MLSQFSEIKKSYWLTVPLESNLIAIENILSDFPGGSGKCITADVYNGKEIYFSTDLGFQSCLDTVIDKFGLVRCTTPIKKRRTGIRGRPEKKIPIVQYDPAGNKIREWLSILRASKELGISAGNISLCCTGKRQKAGGYRWEYKNN